MPDERLAQQLGELQGRMAAVESVIKENARDIKTLLRAVNEAKGGWKTLMLVGGVAGAAGAVVTKLSSFVGAMPK